jgi:hypothetical protein
MPISDIPVWIGSIATAASFGLLAANAISARTRAQAERISAWLQSPGGPVEITDTGTQVRLRNSSDDLVYEVVVCLVLVQGAGPRTGQQSGKRTVLGVLPPGAWTTSVPRYDNVGMSWAFGVEIAFTDRGGRHWLRGPEGKLKRIRRDPIAHYRIGRPTTFMQPIEVPRQ